MGRRAIVAVSEGVRALPLVALPLLAACGGGGSVDVSGNPAASASAGGIALPRALDDRRSLDPARLIAIVFVDGDPIVAERRGDRWVAAFDLRGVTAVQVEWRYETGTGTLVVARSAPVTVDPDDPSRSLVVDDYDTAGFDADGDGIDNLSEIDAGSDPFGAGGEAREFVVDLGIPDDIEGVIAAGELIPALELDGQPVPSEREGERWSWRFTIEDEGTHRFTVTWSTLYERTVIAVARSAAIAFTRDSPLSDLNVSTYDTASFDADGDGIPNLLELSRGSDPLVGATQSEVRPGVGQEDCRDATDEYLAEYLGEALNERLEGSDDVIGSVRPLREPDEGDDVFIVSEPGTDSLVFPRGADRPYLFATFYADRAGTLSIAHAAGVPVNTAAVLYETRTRRDGSSGTFRSLAESGFQDGERAAVSAELERGIYCYTLFTDDADEASFFFGDVVLSEQFTPR